jgi:hypothetical protein
MKLIIDCETNAIKFSDWNKGDRSSLTHLHCVCAIDADTGDEYTYEGENLDAGLFLIYTADELIGHNIEFDLNVMEAWTKRRINTDTRTFCTYRRAKSMFPQGFREDRILNPDRKRSNSLEAWGYRLGVHKDRPPLDWSKMNPKMASYCMQDCRVTLALYKFLQRRLRWGVLSPIVELCSTR